MKKIDRRTDSIRKPLASSSATPEQVGVIIAHHGVAVEVLFDSGGRSMVRVKRNSGHVVGDNVVVRTEVLERLPRRTELRRRDAMGGIHLVGANLDLLGVVVSSAPLPPAGFIDRAIVAARAADLTPFLVVNKSDLGSAGDYIALLCAVYSGSLAVFPLSAATGDGLNPLRDFLGQGHRGAFVGATGVGKSSLLNILCPEIDLRVGSLNLHSGRGCNTTTVSTLHSLSSGGELVDTPGFQDFGLVDISAQELALHFAGFEQATEGACRFRDCRHRSEPGCAVADLVAQRLVPAERHMAYLEILGEVEAADEETRRRGWKN